MKSPMIEAAEFCSAEEKTRYGHMQVLMSAAGYYVGTLYDDPDMGKVPGTRDSLQYFATPEDADAHRQLMESGLVPIRDHA